MKYVTPEYYKNPGVAPVKVTVWQVQKWIKRQGKGAVRASDLVAEFKMSSSDASHRLSKLRSWGILKYADRPKRARGGYVMTRYGREFTRHGEDNER